MDLVQYSEDVYNNIAIDYAKVAKTLGLEDITYIPISALDGDNIVDRSKNMDWYEGQSLLHVLENIKLEDDVDLVHPRFPVQYVIRPQVDHLHDYRGYAGKIVSGIYRKGDVVSIEPSGLSSKIRAIEVGGIEVEEAFAPQSVILHLEDDIDISRGDVIVGVGSNPEVSQDLDVFLCWMDNKPLIPGNKYLLQINSRVVRAVVKEINYRLDVNTLERNTEVSEAGLNDVISARIRTASPVAFDSYKNLRVHGGAILIDETSNVTVGAGMIN